jgi:cytochrome c biogenesis protein CcmG/thiol:disulfide interchange protein DsbE
MKRFLLPIGTFVVLLIFLGVGLNRDPHEIPSPLIGKPAPSFQLTQLHDQQKLITPMDLRGKVWMLNVWASWCVSCREEHPVLMKFSERGVLPIIGLNYKDERDAGLTWLNQFGNPYQVSAFDGNGRVGIDYGVYGVPETFIIDKQGVIRMKHVGPVTDEVIKEKLLPLIQELNRA